MTVQLFHIAGNPHADTLLMAYFPKERILVEADVVQPRLRGTARTRRTCSRTSRSTTCAWTASCRSTAPIVPFSELLKTQAAQTN